MRRWYLALVLASLFGGNLHADQLLCSLGMGSGVATSTACVTQGSGAITFNNVFDWTGLTPDTTMGLHSGPTLASNSNPDNPHSVTGLSDGPEQGTNPWTSQPGQPDLSVNLGPNYVGSEVTNPVNLSQNYELELMGNAKAVWDGTEWIQAPPAAMEFPGHFGSNVSATPTAWSYGDTLLADPGGNGPISINFGLPVSAVAFQVSSLSNSTFVATLTAWNAAGQELGSYIVDTSQLTGSEAVGGRCASLANISLQNPVGTPCSSTPAPWIAISDLMLHLPPSEIASVRISVNDPNGFAIDAVEFYDPPDLTTVPEPSAPLLVGAALGVFWYLRRRNFRLSR